LRDSLVRFKFYGALHLGRTLSEILIRAFHRYFDPTHYDLIIPIPIHRKRLTVRGFNQALLLAERLSSHTGIPVDRTTFRKTLDTPPQVGLSRHERVKNLRGSFAVSNPARIRDRRILLVDDVITTGSTIAEAAGTLKRGKASSVSALVLALRIGLPDDRPRSTLKNSAKGWHCHDSEFAINCIKAIKPLVPMCVPTSNLA
jgi:ComF family protein